MMRALPIRFSRVAIETKFYQAWPRGRGPAAGIEVFANRRRV